MKGKACLIKMNVKALSFLFTSSSLSPHTPPLTYWVLSSLGACATCPNHLAELARGMQDGCKLHHFLSVTEMCGVSIQPMGIFFSSHCNDKSFTASWVAFQCKRIW